jgi:hypothetical protein
MSASASAFAPAPALTRVEMVNKTQLQWLLTHANTYVDDTWRPQVTGALHRYIEAYDDDKGGYTVEYRQKRYDRKAMGRLCASCGMQSLYKPFRGHRHPYGACGLRHAQCSPRVSFAALRAPRRALQAPQ